uniref:Uncharacterized protein n=1 Tax=Bracon brevicornis TaxID=1563983 RepID=A0A6V7KL52_9HYME
MDKISLFFEPYKLNELAYIKVAQSLWTNHEIQTHLINSFKRDDGLPPAFNNQLIENVVSNAVELPISLQVKLELIDYISKVSRSIPQIYDVFSKVPRRGANLVYFIKWMPNGDIDMGETIRSSYFAGYLTLDTYTWIVLSMYALVDCMIDYSRKIDISNLTSRDYNNKYTHVLSIVWARGLYNIFQESAVPSWVNRLIGDDFDEKSSEIFLSILSFDNISALKYYWNCTDKRGRRFILDEAFRMFNNPLNAQTAVFLWSHWETYFSTPEFGELLTETRIFELFLEWPYYNLLLNSLDRSWYRFSHNEILKMLAYIKSVVIAEFNMNPFVSKYNELFLIMWRNLGLQYKKDFKNWIFLFHTSTSTLAHIINDPDLLLKRNKMITYVATLYGKIHSTRGGKVGENCIDMTEMAWKFVYDVLRNDTEDSTKFMNKIFYPFRNAVSLTSLPTFWEDIGKFEYERPNYRGVYLEECTIRPRRIDVITDKSDYWDYELDVSDEEIQPRRRSLVELITADVELSERSRSRSRVADEVGASSQRESGNIYGRLRRFLYPCVRDRF